MAILWISYLVRWWMWRRLGHAKLVLVLVLRQSSWGLLLGGQLLLLEKLLLLELLLLGNSLLLC